jgi:hypothetical protein
LEQINDLIISKKIAMDFMDSPFWPDPTSRENAPFDQVSSRSSQSIEGGRTTNDQVLGVGFHFYF